MKRIFAISYQAIKYVSYILALILINNGCLSNPFKSRETTVFGTITDYDTSLPVENVELGIWVLGGSLNPKVKKVQTVYTDKNGKYSATVDIPNEYHSLNIDVIFDINKYVDFFVYVNGQPTQSCCQADQGLQTQYDFKLQTK